MDIDNRTPVESSPRNGPALSQESALLLRQWDQVLREHRQAGAKLREAREALAKTRAQLAASRAELRSFLLGCLARCFADVTPRQGPL
jgi:hypothetical protein